MLNLIIVIPISKVSDPDSLNVNRVILLNPDPDLWCCWIRIRAVAEYGSGSGPRFVHDKIINKFTIRFFFFNPLRRTFRLRVHEISKFFLFWVKILACLGPDPYSRSGSADPLESYSNLDRNTADFRAFYGFEHRTTHGHLRFTCRPIDSSTVHLFACWLALRLHFLQFISSPPPLTVFFLIHHK